MFYCGVTGHILINRTDRTQPPLAYKYISRREREIVGISYQWKLYGALYCSRIDDLRCIYFSSSFQIDLRDCYGLIYILRLNFYSPDTDSVYNLALGITNVFIYFCDFLFVFFLSSLDFVDCDHVLKDAF